MTSHTILIVIDGCRPDALAQANTPHLDALWQAGARTRSARSVMPSISLCAHTSMFRGVKPEKHGVGGDNIYNPQAAAYPSIIDVLHRGGRRVSMFYTWEELRDLAAPGSVYHSHYRRAQFGLDNDTPLVQVAAEQITADPPDFAFVYLGDVDLAGHAFGWMSAEYIAALERNDAAVGHLLKALEAAHLRERCTFLILADHGGHDFTHGTESPEDMRIPWLLSGRGAKVNHDLQGPVMIYDTAATVARLMGLECPESWDGQPVVEALA